MKNCHLYFWRTGICEGVGGVVACSNNPSEWKLDNVDDVYGNYSSLYSIIDYIKNNVKDFCNYTLIHDHLADIDDAKFQHRFANNSIIPLMFFCIDCFNLSQHELETVNYIKCYFPTGRNISENTNAKLKRESSDFFRLDNLKQIEEQVDKSLSRFFAPSIKEHHGPWFFSGSSTINKK